MAMKKQIKTKPDEEINVQETTPEITEEIKKDIAVIDESETKSEPEQVEEIKENPTESTTTTENSIDKTWEELKDTVTKAVKDICANKAKQEPKEKKPFKLEFWGYLGLAVVVKGAVDITRAICDAKNPRR